MLNSTPMRAWHVCVAREAMAALSRAMRHKRAKVLAKSNQRKSSFYRRAKCAAAVCGYGEEQLLHLLIISAARGHVWQETAFVCFVAKINSIE